MVETTGGKRSTLFAETSSYTIRLALFALLAIGLMIADHRGHYLDRVRSVASVALHPVYQSVHLPVAGARWLAQRITTRQQLLARNRRLERLYLRAQASLHRLSALEAENQQLKKLLQSASTLDQEVLAAQLLSVDLDPYSQRVLLNKGARQGVFVGQALMDAHGVMGQVIQVNPLAAQAMLISDPGHAVPVQVARTGLRSIAYGSGRTDRLSLPNVPTSADVRRGDRLVTSGLGGRFPRGLPVAEVVRVEWQPGESFAHVTARPAAALNRSRDVLLLWTRERGGEQGPAASARGAVE